MSSSRFNRNFLKVGTTALALSLMVPFGPAVNADHHGDPVAAAVANSNRNPKNVARDVERKAGDVVRFYGVKPGDTVLDFFSGGGYFAEVFSGTVGAEGKVYAHQRPGARFDRIKEKLTEHYTKFPNIELMVGPAGKIDLPDNSVDVVMLSLMIHHLHFSADTPDELPARSRAIFAEVKRVLKPGGTFGVIEHAAIEGASRKDSSDWHRIAPEMAIADITSAGFEYAGSSDIHTNPDDDMMSPWGPAGLRGKTTRLVQKFTKP